MMKRVVKTLVVCLCALLLGTNAVYAEVPNLEELNKISSQMVSTREWFEKFGPGKVYLEEQSKSIDTYFEIKEEINTNKDKYQDTYAGMYIDENGELNILVTDSKIKSSKKSSEQIKAECKKNMDTYETLADTYAEEKQDVIIKEAEYSYEELKNIQENLMDHTEELGIISTSIIQKENLVEVGYLSESAAFDQKKVIEFAGHDDCLRFIEIGSVQEDAGVVRNGSKVMITSEFTMACGAKLGNTYGFVTAGHVGNVGQSVYYNGEKLGTITHKNYGRQSDVAFIARSNNNWLSTTKFIDQSAFSTGKDMIDGALYVSGGFPEGTGVIKYGITTGKTWGKITSTSFNRTGTNGVKFDNLVAADYKAESGDSGGPIQVGITRNGVTRYYCAGIHSGSTFDSAETRNGAFYTDMDFAKANLGFVGFYNTTNVN